MYEYDAKVVRVIDGDTVVLDIDLGCKVWLHDEHCRLLGINAPEMRGPSHGRGLAARLWLLKFLPPGQACRIATQLDRTGKYGRLLIEIWPLPVDGIELSLNQKMVAAGHAVEQVY